MSVQTYNCINALNQFAASYETNDPDVNSKDPENADLLEEKQSETFLQELKKYDPIIVDITSLEKFSDDIAEAREAFDNVYAQEKKNEIITRVDNKLKKARQISKRIKEALTAPRGIKDQNEAYKSSQQSKGLEGSVQLEIRENLYNYYMKKYFNAHMRYTKLAKVFKDKVHMRAKRDLKYLAKNMTDEEAEELIEQGKDREFIEGQLNGDEQELSRLLNQHEEVKEIQKEVREILTMFEEMAALVDAQQETIDNITTHISGAKDYTGSAVVELKAAADYQLAARKKMCACAVIVLLVLATIIIIILAAAGVFDQKNDDNNDNNNN
mmetsp:Transcript_10293/g.18791  ORF Transcript_10293/g.18791 Transcript_10293/m.18791 type:complete len:326 (-) Transcript_10293:269-1246(-)|eukprot:CAMPEP_0197524738 /NCGR_PEP_ID=MMETSP1318-20131121/9730_1 /TAXON_ID=552666 /ORGANISM="Partenskyella glossopodia, Strain RCC365" /LENGTH=325 /DNA_ID=CAMNT_0043077757 /DNA_START=136 /DNA_END=1116 /DNA_ORIENTATION=+